MTDTRARQRIRSTLFQTKKTYIFSPRLKLFQYFFFQTQKNIHFLSVFLLSNSFNTLDIRLFKEMKNKFALCFRPVVIETEEPDPDDHHHNNRVIISDIEVSKNIIVAKAQKKNGMNPSFLDGNISGSLQVPCFPLPEKHSRKTLSRVLRTILFETSAVSFLQERNRYLPSFYVSFYFWHLLF